MLARDAMKAAIKSDFVPFLRESGFRGTYPEWRMTKGDDVVVARLAIGGYPEGTYAEFSVLLAVVPSSWWDWTHDAGTVDLFASTSMRGREHEYDGFSFVLDPKSSTWRSDHQWAVDSPRDAEVASAQMTAALRTHGLSQVLELLEIDRLIEVQRADEVPLSSTVSGAVWERDVTTAVLLERGGGEALEAACRSLEQYDPEQSWSATPLRTAAWIRERMADSSM